MSNEREEDEGKRDKKVTAAIADQPMEEFISPTNQPSVPEQPEAPERRTEERGAPANTLNEQHVDNPRERKSTAQ